ncbi:alpha/beta fold hydrolase [Nocardia cyriacigeorgica]|uniref:alpha/beta fold hydrolase n=1 Tax=Nocardia cyriacigeorgica TaxID=135487 RepID=UPI003980BEFE
MTVAVSRRTTVPTTYVWRTADTALDRAAAERCGEFVEVPEEFVVLDGARHRIPEERPEELTQAIRARAGS